MLLFIQIIWLVVAMLRRYSYSEPHKVLDYHWGGGMSDTTAVVNVGLNPEFVSSVRRLN